MSSSSGVDFVWEGVQQRARSYNHDSTITKKHCRDDTITNDIQGLFGIKDSGAKSGIESEPESEPNPPELYGEFKYEESQTTASQEEEGTTGEKKTK